MDIYERLQLNMDRHRHIALVGGGGKTTLLYALALEAREHGQSVVVTTTTHMFPHPRIPRVEDISQWNGEGIVTLGAFNAEGRKMSCRNVPDLPCVTVMECDGARVRPFKAPADHEPVIPPFADAVIAVAGADCFGKPIGEICHRPERVAALLGTDLDHLITPADVARVLASPAGGRKSVPAGAAFRCAVNKADGGERRELALRCAEELRCLGVAAAVTSFTEEERGGLCWF